MQAKVCSKCKKTLPLSDFHKYERRSATHYSQCKHCKAEYKRENKEKLLVAQRKRRQNNAKYNEKQRTWNKVYYALSNGRIKKPLLCSICGKSDIKIQAHHDNYTKPFDIIWCCQSCHVQLDENRRAVL